MEVVKFLGDKLVKKINISPPSVRGLLKLAIKDELGPFKPISELDFNDFVSIVRNSLKERLIKLNISNNEILIGYLLYHLTKNQSLITMTKV